MFRERWLNSEQELPEVRIDIDAPEQNVVDRQIEPVVPSVRILTAPSLSCVHNNNVVVVNISNKQINNSSSGKISGV